MESRLGFLIVLLKLNFAKYTWAAVDCKMTDTGIEYSGTLSVTESGKSCQRWDSVTPHSQPYADRNIHHNYCRNPQKPPAKAPWCYTTDPLTRREYCNIPFCATLPESSTTAVIGTTVKECPPGQEVTGVLCKMCPKDSYKKGTNSDQCKPCPDDENGRSGYTSTVGSSRCLYDPYIAKIYPLYGPKAGGTRLCISIPHTENFQPLWAALGEAGPFNLSKINATKYELISPSSSSLKSVSVTVYLNNMTSNVVWNLMSEDQYRYLPDPIITRSNRKVIIQSGGLEFEVYGHHLTSVAEPKARITAVKKQQETVLSSACTHKSSYMMLCEFPDLSKQDIHENEFYIGFIMDGIREYEVMYQITVVKDPSFYYFTEPENVKTVYVYQTSLTIMGDRINEVLEKHDIRVTVGDSTCHIKYLESKYLTCKPPEKQPGFGSPGEGPRKSVTVVIFYGRKTFVPGHLLYVETIDITVIVVPIVVAVFVFIAITSVVIIIRRKRNRNQKRDNVYLEVIKTESESKCQKNTESAILPIQLQQCVIDFNDIILEQCIGTGNFGRVYKGFLKPSTDEQSADNQSPGPCPVAVKSLLPGAGTNSVDEFFAEAALMVGLSHPNVIYMYGVCLHESQPYCVLEYMDLGSLKDYLSAVEQNVNKKNILWYCLQIARGMEYLTQNHCVHRDLAARNCLINSSEKVKIGDFGLSRDIYVTDYYKYETKDRPLPVRWMALESLNYGKYTVKSDMWSFGVVMWELFTRGSKPYADVSNYDLKKYLLSGHRLHQPQNCSSNIYVLMSSCWLEDANSRPSFSDIILSLTKIMKEETDYLEPLEDHYELGVGVTS